MTIVPIGLGRRWPWGGPPWAGLRAWSWAAGAFPPIDLFETESEIVVSAEVPGVDPANLDVKVQGDRVQITGKAERSQEAEDQGYYCSERSFGSFDRTIQLPSGTDPAGARAIIKNGVLEIRLRKADSVNRLSVQVEAS